MLAKRLLMASTALALSLAAAPALAEPVTIRLVSKDLLNSNPQDVAHIERIEKALAERGTEVDIEIVEVASSGYADKLSAMILSGDIPDLLYFQGGDAKIAEQGVLEDLNPWIEKSEFLKDALYPHNVERLKNYPYLLYVYPVRIPQPVVRSDWLEKTGLDAPQTVEDYVALYTALATGDLDGDGQDNTYGVTTAENTNELDAIYNQAYGITATWLQNDAGEWIHSRVSPQEKDKITFYASLREQGLYDPEYVTTKWDIKEDKFYTGRAGTISGSSMEVIDIYGGKMRQLHPGVELTLLDPPQGPGGKGLQAVDVSKESRGFAISALSEHKEEAFAILDFMASPEGQMMDRLGFEGEQYVRNGDQIEVTDEISTWYARFMAAANWTPPVQWMSEAAQQSLENIKTYYSPDNAFVWPAAYAADLDATENVYRSWVYKFISGEAGMDQWDAYVAEWNAAGGERLTDYARTVLNAAN
jgi:putative aldouronate transport system substrate-binding protein